MPICIQFIYKDKTEKEEQVCNKREIVKITFNYFLKKNVYLIN
jgi:hypothetical protein